MNLGNWMALLQRQSKAWEPVTWNEVVVGYDFGFLPAAEIQRWVRCHGFRGEACRRLAEAADAEALRGFEPMLWEACREATGRLPRPGGAHWARAQDRWRIALLRDALDAGLSTEALAVVIETIWERVGCPEDMLGLWHRPSRWEPGPASVDHRALHRFLDGREEAGNTVAV